MLCCQYGFLSVFDKLIYLYNNIIYIIIFYYIFQPYDFLLIHIINDLLITIINR